MKSTKFLRTLAALLLVLNGVTAILAGVSMILNPSGNGLKMDVSQLNDSPFQNYLIPGIVLFVMNGICSMTVLYLLVKQHRFYPVFVIAQGIILTGWIALEIILITDASWLQLIYGFAGLVLIGAGLKLEYYSRMVNAFQKI